MVVVVMILHSSLLTLHLHAQPAARRAQQQQAAAQKNNGANTLSTRAQISYPAALTMSEDVVWRRDIYREIDLTEGKNAGLYYPEEPVGDQMNLFTYMFKLMLSGKIKVYEYRLDGNEAFNDSARVRPLDFMDNYGIYYQRNGKSVHIDNSDIPSRDVKAYYLKESAYYDQASATFHKKVVALCPIMKRMDDFGDSDQSYPLFWVKYDDLAPFLAKQTIMTSDLNNAATMTADDYFTKNMYRGKIYKTNNMLGKTLRQIVGEDEEKLSAEQKRIEAEIEAFEKGIFGTEEKKDSVAVGDEEAAVEKKPKSAKKAPAPAKKSSGSSARNNTKSKATASKKPKASASKPSSSSTARVSARRERH